MKRWLVNIAGLVLALAALAGCFISWWLHQPLHRQGDSLELVIEPGTSPRAVAQGVVRAGAMVSEELLYQWFRWSGESRKIRAGNYEIPPTMTPSQLLTMLVRGEESLIALTLVEGWSFRQVRQLLSKSEHIRPEIQGLSDEKVMEMLGRPGIPAEGRFFPDTYSVAKGSSDLALLRRAMHAMDRQLEASWAQRQPGLPLRSADDALILASIVEKETGRAADRPMIAGVFVNRLRQGMMLQTDPTVIYGLGDRFDGNLRKRDLQTDTPWNTYTRFGLPPTPIAMPGKAALMAAVQPASTRALYFVARGDGSSQFSDTLTEHNRAVQKYQRGS